MPEFIPDDATQQPEFVVADDDSAPLYEVVEESPATPYQPPRVPTRKRPKQSNPGGAFGEWIRGQGLWILDGVGLGVFGVIVFLKMPNSPPGASGAYLVGTVVGMICGLVIALPLGLAIGALILRLACRLCQVGTPEFTRCMGIVMLIGTANAVINQIVGLAVDAGDAQHPNLGAAFAALAIGIVVGAAASIPVLIVTLEISVGRAALVWLIEMLLAIAIGIVLGLLCVGIFMALGLSLGSLTPTQSGPPQMMPLPGQQSPGSPIGPGQQFPGMPQGPGQQVPGMPSGPGQGYPGMPRGPGQP